MTFQLDLFSAPAPAAPPAPAVSLSTPAKPRFTGPADRRALVVTGDYDLWREWCRENAAGYSAAFWLLSGWDLRQWNRLSFEVVFL